MQAGGWVLVDLSGVCFMSAGCAADLLRLTAQAGGYDRVVVRCSGLHARTLRHLGAAGIARLVIHELAEDR